jgi:hypothetical protein
VAARDGEYHGSDETYGDEADTRGLFQMIDELRTFGVSTRQPSAFIPIAMSLAALATVLYHMARFGLAPQADEGAAAHIWQLLIAGQIPVVVFHAIRWLPLTPTRALQVLALQVGAALAALAPVYWLGW